MSFPHPIQLTGFAVVLASLSAASPSPSPAFVWMGSDNCATPTVIAGLGAFAFDNSAATVGSQGQSEPLCNFFGTTTIDKDVWFEWTAPSTGSVTLSLCGGTSIDSKVAVYAGSGCPGGAALACNDDACALQSSVSWSATAGTTYALQIGVFPATSGGAGTLTLVATPSNDDCATPLVLVGAGPHPFDTTGATTGTQGQSEAPCLFAGTTAIERDVWFRWSATLTGTVYLSACGSTGDTKIAVYPGSACPSPGSALACNDDACGTASALSFAAVAGSDYVFQVGVRPGTSDAVGTITLSSCPTPANDTSSAPTTVPIGGSTTPNRGPHPFDNCGATGSPEGCSGTVSDVWYRWSAPPTSGSGGCSSGRHRVRMIGPTPSSFSGGGAAFPQGMTTESDLLGCGAVMGSTLMQFDAASTNVDIALGSFGSAEEATAQWCVDCLPNCGYQEGVSGFVVGQGSNGENGWMNMCGEPGLNLLVTAVEVAWGSPLNAAAAPPNGTPGRIAVWEDPNDDGNPIDAVLLATDNVIVAATATDALTTYVLPSSVIVSGRYFVGATVGQIAARESGPLSTNACDVRTIGTYFFANTGGSADLTNLFVNSTPPTPPPYSGFDGAFLLRSVWTIASPGTGFCFGDGSGTPCPCGNSGAAGNGCASSVNASGANLAATGTASISADSIVLLGSGMPATGQCLYFQGTTQISAVFGDGLRCAGGSVVRLGTKANSGGASQYPSAGDPSVSVKGLVPPGGGVRTYQGWYRNAAAFCTPSTFNLTNGLSINWVP